jgi:hypothetical protein
MCGGLREVDLWGMVGLVGQGVWGQGMLETWEFKVLPCMVVLPLLVVVDMVKVVLRIVVLVGLVQVLDFPVVKVRVYLEVGKVQVQEGLWILRLFQ